MFCTITGLDEEIKPEQIKENLSKDYGDVGYVEYPVNKDMKTAIIRFKQPESCDKMVKDFTENKKTFHSKEPIQIRFLTEKEEEDFMITQIISHKEKKGKKRFKGKGKFDKKKKTKE